MAGWTNEAPIERWGPMPRAVEQETVAPQGLRYLQADLCALPDLGASFDAVVVSMVLPAVPDWTGAMRACVHALKPGGLFVFTVNHPCFEQLWSTWRSPPRPPPTAPRASRRMCTCRTSSSLRRGGQPDTDDAQTVGVLATSTSTTEPRLAPEPWPPG